MVICFGFIFKPCVCFVSGRSAPMTAAIPAIALWRQMRSVPTGSAVRTARCLTIYLSICFSLSPRLPLSHHLYCDSHLVRLISTFSLKSAHHLLLLSLLSKSPYHALCPQLKQAGTMCRGQAGACDLPEYCTGGSPYCPANVYLLDASPCQNGRAYCYNGMCLTHEQQCLQLWGYGEKHAV